MLLAVVAATVTLCLFVLREPAWAFLSLFVSLVLVFEAASRKPEAVAERKAIELHATLEKQVRDWNAIINELKRLREKLRRGGHTQLLDECSLLLKDARLDLRDARSRLDEHRQTFNTEYWVYQDLDQWGRPRKKYVVHRGLCDSCNSGRSKPSRLKKWDGPYDEWEHAQGVGTRSFCIVCCNDLRDSSG